VAVYRYCGGDGSELFQVVRFANKVFRPRRGDPDRPGAWRYDLHGVPRVLYRLPELRAAAPGEPVFVTEGEKDVDRLRAAGLVATCNPGGAGKWRDEYSPWLAGRDVVIIPDNDDAGRAHAAEVARAVAPFARSVRVVALPGLPGKGDASDYLAAGGSAAALRALAAAAPVYRPAGASDASPPRRAPARPHGPYRPAAHVRPMPGEPRRDAQLMDIVEFDSAEVLDAVRPYLAELAEELGLRFAAGRDASPEGWRACHAVGRRDRNPSASLNLINGYYYDH
jgi:hypothetical protein